MRTGLLFDIHGNLPALEAVLASARAEADELYHGGDLVGWGPQPNEVVATVAEAGIPGVAGNHELLALGAYTEEQPLRNASTTWTREQLRPETVELLAGLPATIRTEHFLLAHANPAAWQEPADAGCFPYVYDSTALMAQPPGFAQAPGGLILTGHVHEPAVYVAHLGGMALEPRVMGAGDEELEVTLATDQGAFVVAGAVGKPRDGVPTANYLVLDVDTRTITLRRVTYDVAPVCAMIEASGLPRALAEELAEGR